jgi:hypothetical protein
MKKVLLALLSIGIAFTAIQPAQAQEQKVIAIIDTAIDSSKFNNIVHEVCFTTLNACPNGSSFQEGVGSANVSNWELRDIDHGHKMAKVATATDSNIKIVFIRISDINTRSGGINSYPVSISRATQWVSENAEKFNIRAVSISMSLGIQTPSSCVKYTGYKQVLDSTQSLSDKNIPVFAATGNNRSKTGVGFPACVDGVIGVGAFRNLENISTATNSGHGLDLIAKGNMKVEGYKGNMTTVGETSPATQVAAVLSVLRGINGQMLSFLPSLPKVSVYPYIG